MAMIELPDDFKEFLKLLNSTGVEYLVVGGYAVGYHGYPRATGDIDIWVSISPDNASRLVRAMKEFGFGDAGLNEETLLQENQVVTNKLASGRKKDLADLEQLPE